MVSGSRRHIPSIRMAADIVPALVLAVPTAAITWQAARAASFTMLGRDQGIFQYIAWAILRGDTDYRDVRDVNGPLTHLVHMIMLLVGGADEHRFRLIDLAINALVFFCMGASLPGLSVRAPAARRSMWLSRCAWGLAAVVLLGGQYLRYLYWDLAQRETFCDWLLVLSLALGLLSSIPRALSRRAAALDTWMLVGAGALSTAACFGKHTYAMFVACALATLALDREAPRPRRRRVFWFLCGCVLSVAFFIAFIVRFGDLAAFVQTYLLDAPAMYRFIWPRPTGEIVELPWARGLVWPPVLVSVAMVILIAVGLMPRRLFAVACVGPMALLAVIAQKKGFPYHFHPVSLGLTLGGLALAAWAWERWLDAPRRWASGALSAAMMLALTIRETKLMPYSPHVQNPWTVQAGATPELRRGEAYLNAFRAYDFFPKEMHEAAAYLRANTEPHGRVQIYGMDPYVLFLAERLSATPYIYAYDLNTDAAEAGAEQLSSDAELPERLARIRAFAERHGADMVSRMEKQPPSAIVFFDKAPLTSWPDAVVDFEKHQPVASQWVKSRYAEAIAFGEVHVWLPKERVAHSSVGAR